MKESGMPDGAADPGETENDQAAACVGSGISQSVSLNKNWGKVRQMKNALNLVVQKNEMPQLKLELEPVDICMHVSGYFMHNFHAHFPVRNSIFPDTLKIGSEWKDGRLVVSKDSVYFIEPDPDDKPFDQAGKYRYLEHIKMSEIKSVFIKHDQKEVDAGDAAAAPDLLRKISRYVPLTPTKSTVPDSSDEGSKAVKIVSSRHGYEFQIETFDEEDALKSTKKITGEFSGKSYHIRVNSKEKIEKTVEKLRKLVKKTRSDAERKGMFEMIQLKVLRYYKSAIFQALIAWLILTVQSYALFCVDACSLPLPFLSQNFGLDVYSAQIASLDTNDIPSQTRELLDQINTLFVFIFTAELGVNVFCRWFWPFFRSAWCIFDLIIVGLSLISLAPTGLPFDLLLLFRCCRVLRVVGRFKTVKSIFNILMRSIVPMASAFFLVFLLSSMCKSDSIFSSLLVFSPGPSLIRSCFSLMVPDAIAGVTFFSKTAPGYFDTFARGFVSMFRITLGSVDWWYEIFPIVESDGSINMRPSFFLISYVIVVNWFFFQITVAVLLEICQEASRDEGKRKEAEQVARKQKEKALRNPLDPLLLELSQEFVSEEDLDILLNNLFTVCRLAL
jgi:hypothetical protein